MSVHVTVFLSKEVDDIDKSSDFVDELRELLVGNVTCSLHSQITNSSPTEELTKEPENEG